MIDHAAPLIRVLGDGSTEWPYSLARFYQDFPHVSKVPSPAAAWLAGFGVQQVQLVAAPAGDIVTELEPQQVGEAWVQQWTARAYTQEERDSLLAERKAEKRLELAEERRRRIDEVTGPQDEKNNLLLQGTLLLNKKAKGNANQQDEDLLDVLEALGNMAIYVREKEAEIDGAIEGAASLETLDQIDVKDAARWL